jgi:hypothetical protein
MNGQPAHARLEIASAARSRWSPAAGALEKGEDLAISSDALAAGVLVDLEGCLIDVLSDG